MKNYRVFINGKNFLLNFDGKAQKIGFYTNRFVQADNPEAAEYAAVDMLRCDEGLLLAVLNETNDAPRLYVDEIEEIPQLCEQHGFTFYPEHEEDEVV